MRCPPTLSAMLVGCFVGGCTSGGQTDGPLVLDDAGQHDGSTPAGVHVRAGSCAVVADFTLPLDRWSSGAPLVRMADGFMARGGTGDGAAARSVLLFTSEDGQVQTPWETELTGFPLGASPGAP